MTTKLNPAQLHLLELFSHDLSPDKLDEIKVLLADYFVRRADDEMARLQQQKPTTQADLDALLNAHLRMPYQPR
ncbi:hypothetical protein ACO2Q8_17315 [Larkinella sp. VNQ87]|uniref:hypothetical protein n=1 Tax=Larkinella sp. VNQ87 TaxID=3400921 RepID=UPI003BFD8F21